LQAIEQIINGYKGNAIAINNHTLAKNYQGDYDEKMATTDNERLRFKTSRELLNSWKKYDSV
jgi:hypothetical protein